MTAVLEGRTAVVTGGGNGLGRAISCVLASRGVRVAVLGRDEAKLDAVTAEIRRDGGDALAVVCDTTDAGAVSEAAVGLDRLDVSILINNAGVGGPVAALVDIEPQEWDEVFAVNVRGTYLMCRALLPAMIRRGAGDIINVASVAAKRPLAARTPYGASKAAVLGLTWTLAAEVASSGIAVNALSPGPVAGPRMDRNFRLESERRGISRAQAEDEYVSRAASRRMVTEEEVGLAVVAMLGMPGLMGADIDLSAGMFAR